MLKELMKTLDGDGILEYDANNSGGYWWLSDLDWKELEEAGWIVHWIYAVRNDFGISTESGRRYTSNPLAQIDPNYKGDDYFGDTVVARATNYKEAAKIAEIYGHYLGGALAASAAKRGPDPMKLVDEFSTITGINPAEQGCNCCGPPHSFKWTGPDGEVKYGEMTIVERFTGFAA